MAGRLLARKARLKEPDDEYSEADPGKGERARIAKDLHDGIVSNFIQNIPGPLLDRMEVVEFAGYTEREKAEIAKKYLIPRQIEESGLGDKNVSFTDDAVTSRNVTTAPITSDCR